LQAQYQSEMNMAQQVYANDMDRFSAEIEAAKFLMGANGGGGRGGGNPFGDAMEMLQLQREYEGQPQGMEMPNSVEALIAQKLFTGEITPEQAGEMRSQIYPDKSSGTDAWPGGSTADAIFTRWFLSQRGASNFEELKP
jgi:hypothetical protein